MSERSLLALQIGAGAVVGSAVALLALALLRDTLAPRGPDVDTQASTVVEGTKGTEGTKGRFGPQPSAISPQPFRDSQLELLLEAEARQVPGTAYIHVRVDGGGEARLRADE